jgi:hypothetical protein
MIHGEIGGAMPRMKRVQPRNALFHAVSRVAHKEFFFDEKERDIIVDEMRRVAAFSGVDVVSYCIMSNHIHITAAGTENNIKKLFALFRRFLGNYLRSKGFCCDLSSFTPHYRMIGTLQDLRNVISYTNRNGFVISPDDTPFSYRWGANSYFFNYAAKERYYESTSFLSRTKRRELIRSHDSDTIVKIKTVDDYACPMDFCAITFAEKNIP